MSYKAIPGVVYTNPEIAGVGKTEEELQAEGTPYTVKKIPMAFSGRFVAENEQGNEMCIRDRAFTVHYSVVFEIFQISN